MFKVTAYDEVLIYADENLRKITAVYDTNFNALAELQDAEQAYLFRDNYIKNNLHFYSAKEKFPKKRVTHLVSIQEIPDPPPPDPNAKIPCDCKDVMWNGCKVKNHI